MTDIQSVRKSELENKLRSKLASIKVKSSTHTEIDSISAIIDSVYKKASESPSGKSVRLFTKDDLLFKNLAKKYTSLSETEIDTIFAEKIKSARFTHEIKIERLLAYAKKEKLVRLVAFDENNKAYLRIFVTAHSSLPSIIRAIILPDILSYASSKNAKAFDSREITVKAKAPLGSNDFAAATDALKEIIQDNDFFKKEISLLSQFASTLALEIDKTPIKASVKLNEKIGHEAVRKEDTNEKQTEDENTEEDANLCEDSKKCAGILLKYFEEEAKELYTKEDILNKRLVMGVSVSEKIESPAKKGAVLKEVLSKLQSLVFEEKDYYFSEKRKSPILENLKENEYEKVEFNLKKQWGKLDANKIKAEDDISLLSPFFKKVYSSFLEINEAQIEQSSLQAILSLYVEDIKEECIRSKKKHNAFNSLEASASIMKAKSREELRDIRIRYGIIHKEEISSILPDEEISNFFTKATKSGSILYIKKSVTSKDIRSSNLPQPIIEKLMSLYFETIFPSAKEHRSAILKQSLEKENALTLAKRKSEESQQKDTDKTKEEKTEVSDEEETKKQEYQQKFLSIFPTPEDAANIIGFGIDSLDAEIKKQDAKHAKMLENLDEKKAALKKYMSKSQTLKQLAESIRNYSSDKSNIETLMKSLLEEAHSNPSFSYFHPSYLTAQIAEMTGKENSILYKAVVNGK